MISQMSFQVFFLLRQAPAGRTANDDRAVAPDKGKGWGGIAGME
jgi:hypothetical protein